MRFLLVPALVSALAVLASAPLGGVRDAAACGVFIAPRTASLAELEARLPYLASERVLIVWDKTTDTEDFIREARFEKADQPFGFIVPVPSPPEVFKVDKPPFERLDAAFPYEARHGLGDLRLGSGGGVGSGSQAPAKSPVTVISEQRIGSFTAFVLAANDGAGLDRWLSDNGFGSSAPARAWLDHYVRLGFFYVALRYEAPAVKAAPAMTSETVRIRFKTALPYYPYLEPAHAGAAPTQPRMLSVWFASQDAMIPVAARAAAGAHVEWARPWHSNDPHTDAAAELRKALPTLEATLPASASMTVVAFRDQKPARDGWGDVLLVPASVAAPLDDAAIAARWRLLPLLDPRLEGALDTKPMPASVAFPSPPSPRAAPSAASPAPSASSASAPAPPPTTKSRCSVVGVDGARATDPTSTGARLFGGAAIAAWLAAGLARRRRAAT